MKLEIVLMCLVGVVIGLRTPDSLGSIDPNYTIFSANEGLTSSDSKLNKILALSEQIMKRIEAIDYK